MRTTQMHTLAEELTGLLIRIGEGRIDDQARKRAADLMSRIRPDDLAQAEKHLLASGLSLQKVHQLSLSFIMLGVLDRSDLELRRRLPDNHILRQVIAEHDLMRCFIADLEECVQAIQNEPMLSICSAEMMRLGRVVSALVRMDQHLEREDDVLYPVLAKHGWQSLFERIQKEHPHIKSMLNDLYALISNAPRIPPALLKAKLCSMVRTLVPLIREHVFYEDRLLFPLAVAMADDPNVWARLKQVSEQIGYSVLT